jgi:pimeloyl-ACP methyl ester carboxylesterase
MRGLRAHVGTKSSRRGGATGLVDLEPAAEFVAVNAVPEEIGLRWDAVDLVPMCYENVVIGIQMELCEYLGPPLPTMRVVVHEVLPHPVEANEMNNRYVGRRIVQEAFRRLATPHTVVTDEVDLAYEVHGPLPTADGRPPLLMIGHPLVALDFTTLASIFLDRTVVTYDPRGLGRSVRKDGRVDHRPEVQAADVHALIQALGAGPVEMFASSGGAVTALALVAAHPGDVRTLVAHEPPLISVLPDAAAVERARAEMRDAYEAGGYRAGKPVFRGLTSWRGELTDDYFAQPAPNPDRLGMPPYDDGKRDHPLLSDRSWALSDYHPNVDALTTAATRVVIAVSEGYRDTVAGRATMATARLLGQEATLFPSHHGGFLRRYFRHESHPAAFAETLREVLDSSHCDGA